MISCATTKSERRAARRALATGLAALLLALSPLAHAGAKEVPGGAVGAAARGAPAALAGGERGAVRDVEEARKLVQAMRAACQSNRLSRVYRPQPDCAPRRAEVAKLGELGVTALRAELLAHLSGLVAHPGQAKQARFMRVDTSYNTLVNSLVSMGTPTAVAALLDVVTAPGVENDPWNVLVPTHRGLQALTKANTEVKPQSPEALGEVPALWRRWRAAQETPPEEPSAAPAAAPPSKAAPAATPSAAAPAAPPTLAAVLAQNPAPQQQALAAPSAARAAD